MKLALVTATYPPDRCGVGDHSARLRESLEALGHAVAVRRSLDEVAADDATVILQYTPPLWARNRFGLNAPLVRSVADLRARGKRVFLIAHELHYPVAPNFRGMLYGIPQRRQFRRLARAVDWTFYTYAAARGTNPDLESEVLPVGSNIDASAASAAFAAFAKRATAPDPPGSIRLAHFGGDHPTHLLEWTLAALAAVRDTPVGRDAMLTLIGISPADRARLLARSGRTALGPFVSATGYLAESEVSRALTESTAVLAPFMDGVSTRRGSAMAAFAHAVPVVTTAGWATDRAIAWESFCEIAPLRGSPVPTSADRDRYVARVVSALADLGALRALGESGRAMYEREFSWVRVADRLTRRLEEMEGPR